MLGACTRLSFLLDSARHVTLDMFAAAYEAVSANLTIPLRRWLLKLCVSRHRYDLIPVLATTTSTATSGTSSLSSAQQHQQQQRRRQVRFAEDRNVTFIFTPSDEEDAEESLSDDETHNARAAGNVDFLMKMMACGIT